MLQFLRISRRWLLFLPALAITSVSLAQTDLHATLPFDPHVMKGKLGNGLTYYIRQNKKPEQKVELRLVVNAGSICEDDNQQGLAHMCEHMAFNGTTHFKKNDIVSFLQDIGVGFGNDLNAYTSFDQTVYILPIPTDKPGNIEKGFQVLEDWAHNVTYLDDDIDGERPIILEESRLGKGAGERMYRKIYPDLLKGSKYAERIPIGKDSIIKNFKYDEIRRFYHDWYRPDLMAVVVVGDIDPAKAEALIKEHFSGLTNPANERPRIAAEFPPYDKEDAMVVTDKEATSYTVAVNYPAFKKAPAETLGDYRNDLVQDLYTSLLNQRLQELTQQENPPFVYGSADFDTYARGYEAFNAFASIGSGDVTKGLRALDEEIIRVEKYGFTQPELDRAKKNLLATYERSYNNRGKTESSDYVEEYMRNFLDKEPVPGIEKEYAYAKELVPGITLAEVNAVDDSFKNDQNLFVYATGPEPKTNEELPDGKDLLAVVSNVAHSPVKPYEEKAIAANLLEKEPKAGKIISRSKNALLGTTELKLSNGVTVTLKPTDFKDDQILMGATRFGGKNNYGVADKYSAQYALSAVEAMGVGDFSPTDLKKVLAGKTASVSPVFTPITEGMKGGSGVKDLETLFQLTYLYFTHPRKDTALFKSFVQRNKAQYAMAYANPQTAFIDTLYQVLYHNDPLAPIPIAKSEYFDKIDLDRALAIYKERFGDANGMHFVFVGSFKEATIIPLIEKYIASLPATHEKFHYVDNKVRPVSGVKSFEVNKGKADKSMILAVYTGEAPYSEQMALAANAMSDALNIRIIDELREKIQGIYGGGTYVSMEKIPYSHYGFVVQLPCGPEKVDTLIKALKAELSDMVENGPKQSDLDKVRKQWLEQYKTNMKENGPWLNELLEYPLNGTDPERFIHYDKYVNQLTAADLQQAARLILTSRNRFYAILMPGRFGTDDSAAQEAAKN